MDRKSIQQGLEKISERLDSQTYVGTYRETTRSSLLNYDGLSTRANSIWKMAQYVIAYYDNDTTKEVSDYIRGWKILTRNYSDQFLFLAIDQINWEMYDYQGNLLGGNEYIERYFSQHKITSAPLNNFPLQQIFYGAPGTGKSNTIKRVVDEQGKINFRTTFHPDSDYSTFVGCYKPTMKESTITKDGVTTKEEKIIYSFCPQAFTNAYVEAWNTDEEVYLIIEEINRGNCAQIFGDLFQLLDRKNGESEYPVEADADLQSYLKKELADTTRADIPEDVKSGKILKLPSNLYIWATMNTSDQSLFPIDSAFKRRWEWKYIPIDTKKENWSIKVGETLYDWSDFLEKINAKIETATSSEDKMLGFYFCKAENGIVSAERFVNKVAFYLWNDVFKDYDDTIFNGENSEKLTFRKFYKADGQVDESKVKLFLENLKVESNVTVADGQGEQTDTL